jgi:hypothetical protein
MDFSDVLGSREFNDTIGITSETKIIGAGGVSATASTTTTITSAIVVPGKGSLRRLDDGTRVTAFIDVYLRGDALTSGHRIDDVSERVADVVTWHGAAYVVCATEDYSSFGAGFIHASCDLQTLNPPT